MPRVLDRERTRGELLKAEGGEWLALLDQKQDLKRVSWNLDWPATEGVVLEVVFGFSGKARGLREAKFNFELLGIKDCPALFISGKPYPSAKDVPWMVDRPQNSLVLGDHERIVMSCFRVGETPDGRPVHEKEVERKTGRAGNRNVQGGSFFLWERKANGGRFREKKEIEMKRIMAVACVISISFWAISDSHGYGIHHGWAPNGSKGSFTVKGLKDE